MFYSSSDNSDGEATLPWKPITLDYSYSMFDLESVSNHLKSSVDEQFTFTVTSMIKDEFHICDETDMLQDNITEKLFLNNNILMALPFELTYFTNLRTLNLSNNNLTHLNDFLGCLVHLQTLTVKNNSLINDNITKSLSDLTKLKEVNFAGNKLTRIPQQLYKLHNLKYLYLGDNEITEVPTEVIELQRLHVLHLGGNLIVQVPDELGQLPNLELLALCDNRLRRLPRAISNLKKLRFLYLHNNNMCCLPVEIVKLRSLTEISLRDNPLVEKFVTCCAKNIFYTPPTLMELAARHIKAYKIRFQQDDIPAILEQYLQTGKSCVNPRCKGVYFTSCVEHIKFVDFCGMYRVPLMHYLCSSRCTSNTPAYYRGPSDFDGDEKNSTLKRVLLG